MNLYDAIEQLDAIHAHLSRSEEYHGYRPRALAASGLAGLLAALLQRHVVVPGDAQGFVRYWVVVAIACALLAAGATLVAYFTREDALQRRRTRIVLGQFVPCLFAGAVLTVALVQRDAAVWWLPGLWALIYGLGIVASLPYLPRPTGLVAAWYLGWGMVLLAFIDSPVPPGWSVGVPFGFGQLLAAFVLQAARREVSP